MEKRLSFVLASFLALAGTVSPLHAQATGGTLSGTVKDGTGGIVPGVTVVIVNTDTSLTRTVITDPGGRYVAADLPPGPYTVKATMEGFTSVLRSGITMSVGRDAVADLQMSLGKLSDEVTVVAEAKTVDTRTASTGGLISTVQIEGLPLNGRSFVELANLTPGVQLTQTGGQSTSTGLGAKLSVNGSRYTANLFTLDGTNLNDQFSQAGSASGNVLGVEAVREFQVLTNSFSAEYGHHTGGIINAATKSGTNSLHGSVFEFHRDDGFDAKNYFDANKPPFTRNQFGYSVGGPILPSRTFFFSTYEGLHERLGETNLFTVPSAAVHQGNVAAAIKPYLDSYPLPNGQAFGTTRGEYGRVDERATDEHYVMGRIDHQLAAGSQLFVRYTLDDAQVDDPSRLNTGSRLKTRVQFVTAEHTQVKGSSFLNRVQFGFTRSRLDGVDYLLEGFTMPRTTFTDIDRGLAAITVTGLSAYGGDTTNPKFHRFNNFQIRDNITWNHGAQNIRIGGDVQIMQFDLTSDFTSMGQYTFSSLDNFLISRVNQFNAVVPGSDASRNLRQTGFGLYVQDDIRARKNLTLNLGVRYEPTTSVSDTKDRLAQLIDFGSATATLNDTTKLTTLFRNPSLKTVAPRVGFAWDVRGDGKTSVRGGAGIFYDSILVSTPFVQNTAVRVPPYFNRGGLVGSSSFVVNFPDAYTTAGRAARRPGAARRHPVRHRPAVHDEMEHQRAAGALREDAARSRLQRVARRESRAPDLHERPHRAGHRRRAPVRRPWNPADTAKLRPDALPRERRHFRLQGYDRRPDAPAVERTAGAGLLHALEVGGRRGVRARRQRLHERRSGRPVPLSKGPRAVPVRRQECGGGQRELRPALRRESYRRSSAARKGVDHRHADPVPQRLPILRILRRGHRPAGPGLGAGIPGSQVRRVGEPGARLGGPLVRPVGVRAPGDRLHRHAGPQFDHRSGPAHGGPDRRQDSAASADRASSSCGSNASTS